MRRVKRLIISMSVAVALAGVITSPASATSGPPPASPSCPQHLKDQWVWNGNAEQVGLYNNSYLAKTVYGPQGGIQKCEYLGTLHETTAPDSPVLNPALRVSTSLSFALNNAA